MCDYFGKGCKWFCGQWGMEDNASTDLPDLVSCNNSENKNQFEGGCNPKDCPLGNPIHIKHEQKEIEHFTHVKREEHQEKLHISHLYDYVSAYVHSSEELEDLIQMIVSALKEAKETKQVQIVDKDGECCFHVTPNEYIILMLPWKRYKIIEE
jgi:hypothetical protein